MRSSPWIVLCLIPAPLARAGGQQPGGDLALLDTEYALPGGYAHVQSVIPQPRRRLSVGTEVRY